MPVDLDNPAAVVIELVVVVIILLVGLTVAPAVGGSSPDGSVGLGGDGEATFVAADLDDFNSVSDSTGQAADLTKGSDVQITGGIGVIGDSWHWSTFASVDDTSRSQVLWSVRQNYILAYDGASSEYVLWYYNSSTTNSYRTTVAASTPGSLTNVQVARSGSTLTLYNSSDADSSISITPGTESSASAPTFASQAGTLEETRTFDTSLNSSERQRLRTDPIKPLKPDNRTARLMFDNDGRQVVIDLRSGASGDIVGGGYGQLGGPRTSGLAGTTLTEGTDYNLTDPGGVKLEMTGAYDRAPRVALATDDTTVETLITSLTGIVDVLLLVVVSALIIRVVRQ